LETGLFFTGSDIDNPPADTPNVIYSNMATMTETVPNADYLISLYETKNTKMVWNGKD
jgi:hypothetical protein